MVALFVRGLPRGVYVLQAGLLLNAFGNGAANPFMLLYLHEVRGIPLAVAGIASAVAAAAALAASLVGGSLTDRFGGRGTMIGGLALSTIAFALYPLIREGWQAIALAAVLGSGAGAWLTGQSSLLARLVDSAQRPLAFAQQGVAANIGLGLGGAVGGLIVTTSDPATFTTLFVLNAATFVVYAGFLVRVPEPPPVAARTNGGSYRTARRGTARRLAAGSRRVSARRGRRVPAGAPSTGGRGRYAGFGTGLGNAVEQLPVPVERALRGGDQPILVRRGGVSLEQCARVRGVLVVALGVEPEVRRPMP
jgi:MFS family permease